MGSASASGFSMPAFWYTAASDILASGGAQYAGRGSAVAALGLDSGRAFDGCVFGAEHVTEPATPAETGETKGRGRGGGQAQRPAQREPRAAVARA